MAASRRYWVSSVVAVFTAGGDAINGKEEGGHYYLRGVRVENGRKVFTEVTPAVFTYSRWHVYSIFLTWPVAMGLLIANNHLARKRSRAGRQSMSG